MKLVTNEKILDDLFKSLFEDWNGFNEDNVNSIKKESTEKWEDGKLVERSKQEWRNGELIKDEEFKANETGCDKCDSKCAEIGDDYVRIDNSRYEQLVSCEKRVASLEKIVYDLKREKEELTQEYNKLKNTLDKIRKEVF